MTGKFVAILMLLCVSQLTFGDDLQKIKENAYQRIHTLNGEFDDGYRKTCDVYHQRPVYLYPIRDRLRDLGESLLELSIIEVNQTALEAKQKVKLVKESPKMNECIQTKAEEALNKLQKSFAEVYVKTLQALLDKAIDRNQWLTDRYSDRYYEAMAEIRAVEGIAREQIKITNNKAVVAQVLADYEERMVVWIRDVLSLEPKYKTNELNFDRTLQNGPVKAYRAFTRRIVDDFIKSVNKCYALV